MAIYRVWAEYEQGDTPLVFVFMSLKYDVSQCETQNSAKDILFGVFNVHDIKRIEPAKYYV